MTGPKLEVMKVSDMVVNDDATVTLTYPDGRQETKPVIGSLMILPGATENAVMVFSDIKPEHVKPVVVTIVGSAIAEVGGALASEPGMQESEGLEILLPVNPGAMMS